MFKRLASGKTTRLWTALLAFVCAIAPAFSYCVCSGRIAPVDAESCLRCAAANLVETREPAAPCCASRAKKAAQTTRRCCRSKSNANQGTEGSCKGERPTSERRSKCCVRFAKSLYFNDARSIQIERPTVVYVLDNSAFNSVLFAIQPSRVDRNFRDYIRGEPPLYILLRVLRN